MTSYTLTGAADWPMFMFLVGIIGGLLLMLCGIVTFMWRDLKVHIKDISSDQENWCERHRNSCRQEVKREFDAVWQVIRGEK